MEQLADNFQDIVLEDLKDHPELLTDLFFQDQDVSIILEKRGRKLRYAYLLAYSAESRCILEEAHTEYLTKKQSGYSREHAFKDLIEAPDHITTHAH